MPALERVQAPVDTRVAGPGEVEAKSPVGAPAVPHAVLATPPIAAPASPPAQLRGAAQAVPPIRESGLEPVREPVGTAVRVPEPVRDRPVEPDMDPSRPTCTQAQLRRFIKSRPWVPMHELRRRFGIYGGDDDVSLIRVGERTLFIGLPLAEGRMMGELLGAGDVGYELSLDPETPVVVGVYPMRPVPRS